MQISAGAGSAASGRYSQERWHMAAVRYVAFLRGINVGGKHIIKKEQLVAMFTAAGMSEVRTVLASGNIVFQSVLSDEAVLVERIEDELARTLGYRVAVLLRTLPYLQEMVAKTPFRAVEPGEDAKLYVMFLDEPVDRLQHLHRESAEQGYSIVEMAQREVYIVTYRLPNQRYGDLTAIERAAGKRWTVRNWNTVQKLAALEQ